MEKEFVTTRPNSEAQLGFHRPVLMMGSAVLVTALSVQGVTPITFYFPLDRGIPTARADELSAIGSHPLHNHFHLSEGSTSTSSTFAMARNFGF